MNFTAYLLVAISCSVMLFGRILCQFDDFPSFFNEFQSSMKAARDPRQDRGPIQFPQAPVGPETSGVRVGASGFGFVPPNRRGPVVGAVGGGGGGPNVGDFFQFW